MKKLLSLLNKCAIESTLGYANTRGNQIESLDNIILIPTLVRLASSHSFARRMPSVSCYFRSPSGSINWKASFPSFSKSSSLRVQAILGVRIINVV